MRLKTLQLNGFKSFAQKTVLEFETPIVSIVGPNGSGKSNVVEAIRFGLGRAVHEIHAAGKEVPTLFLKGQRICPKVRVLPSLFISIIPTKFSNSPMTGREHKFEYDVISISREVYSDGLNKYILNGTEVRLKDIHNLLASVNIGSSGHQHNLPGRSGQNSKRQCQREKRNGGRRARA